MSRIVSVWLPRWPILRFLAAQARCSASPTPVDPEQPFVLAVDASGGPRIAALNAAAEREGLLVGDQAGRRPRQGRRSCRCAPSIRPPTTPRCGAWRCGRRATRRPSRPGARRTAPTASSSTSPAPRICSAARRSCSPICCSRLQRLRPAGAARHRRYARARPGRSPASIAAPTFVLPSGQESEALAPLPIEALRLSPGHARDPAAARLQAHRRAHRQAARTLRRALRAELLQRLDQALGRAARAARLHRSAAGLSQPAPAARADRHAGGDRRWSRPGSCRISSHALERDGVGARSLRLALYRVDGEVATLDIGLDGADAQRRRMSRASSTSSSSASSRRSTPASASRR